MFNSNSIYYFIPFLAFIFIFEIKAQEASDPEFLVQSIENAKELHHSNFEKQELLANGREYVDYDIRIKGHPYFIYDVYQTGSVVYQQNYFKDVNLKYDVHKDLLVLEHYDQFGYGTDVYLINEWVESFYINGHLFKRLFDNVEDPDLDPGFYNVLYDGEIMLISKRYKSLYEDIDVDGISREFLLKDDYYILRENEVYKIKSHRSVPKAFDDRKKEMKKFSKKYKEEFKTQFESALIRAIKYYEELN